MAKPSDDEKGPDPAGLGTIFEFRELNKALAQLDNRVGLCRHEFFSDPDALMGWMCDLGMADDAGEQTARHITDHIMAHPLGDALAAGAFIALLRSECDDIAPRFYVRRHKSYRVHVSRPDPNGGIVVVVDVGPDWGRFGASKKPLPDVLDFNRIEANGMVIDVPAQMLQPPRVG